MRTLAFLLLAAGVTVLIGNALVDADPPPAITYQGRLTDANGKPLQGQFDIQFTLYSAMIGGKALWTETQTITVSDGLFYAYLGIVVPLDHTYFSGNTRAIGISVNGEPELSPRSPIGSVGYAYRIGSIDGAEGGYVTGDLNLSGGLDVAGITDLGETINTPSGVTLQSIGDTLRIVSGTTAIVIRPDGMIVLESDTVSIVSHTSLELSAGTDITISAGTNINLDASANVEIDADLNITATAGSKATMTGSTVEVTGSVTDINGGLVTIN